MTGWQIFSFTPPNPENGEPGYLAAHLIEAPEGVFVRFIVRPDAQENAAPVSLALPWLEATKLVRAIVAEGSFTSSDDPILQFFAFAHLPEHLQTISAPFGIMASHIVSSLPRNAERTVALRKLLEAKDCAVRAAIFKG